MVFTSLPTYLSLPFLFQIPEFDNFYLDMNGIIHMCSHPNDDDPMFRLPEDQIFSEIFKYIEVYILYIVRSVSYALSLCLHRVIK